MLLQRKITQYYIYLIIIIIGPLTLPGSIFDHDDPFFDPPEDSDRLEAEGGTGEEQSLPRVVSLNPEVL